MMIRAAVLSATIGLMSLGSGSAHAQGTSVAFGAIKQDTSQPVEVTADQLAVNNEDGTAIFTGNVVVGQGQMRLSAARVLVIYKQDQSGIQRLEATGGVTLVSGPDAAEAQRADYTIDAGTVQMSGNVLLTQGANALTSERMNINLNDGTARMSGRVKTVLQPKSGTD